MKNCSFQKKKLFIGSKEEKIKDPKKAFRILVEYDIEDIKEAVRIYENNLK